MRAGSTPEVENGMRNPRHWSPRERVLVQEVFGESQSKCSFSGMVVGPPAGYLKIALLITSFQASRHGLMIAFLFRLLYLLTPSSSRLVFDAPQAGMLRGFRSPDLQILVVISMSGIGNSDVWQHFMHHSGSLMQTPYWLIAFQDLIASPINGE